MPASLDLYCLCAAWCRTCDEARPLLAGVLADPDLQGRVQLRWVDIEDEADTLGDYDVETFPTLLIASTGQARFLGPCRAPCRRHSGAAAANCNPPARRWTPRPRPCTGSAGPIQFIQPNG